MEFSRECNLTFDAVDKILASGRSRTASDRGRSRTASTAASAGGTAAAGEDAEAQQPGKLTGLVHPTQGSGRLYDGVMDLLSNACTWVPNVDVYAQVCAEFKDPKNRGQVHRRDFETIVKTVAVISFLDTNCDAEHHAALVSQCQSLEFGTEALLQGRIRSAAAIADAFRDRVQIQRPKSLPDARLYDDASEGGEDEDGATSPDSRRGRSRTLSAYYADQDDLNLAGIGGMAELELDDGGGSRRRSTLQAPAGRKASAFSSMGRRNSGISLPTGLRFEEPHALESVLTLQAMMSFLAPREVAVGACVQSNWRIASTHQHRFMPNVKAHTRGSMMNSLYSQMYHRQRDLDAAEAFHDGRAFGDGAVNIPRRTTMDPTVIDNETKDFIADLYADARKREMTNKTKRRVSIHLEMNIEVEAEAEEGDGAESDGGSVTSATPGGFRAAGKERRNSMAAIYRKQFLKTAQEEDEEGEAAAEEAQDDPSLRPTRRTSTVITTTTTLVPPDKSPGRRVSIVGGVEDDAPADDPMDLLLSDKELALKHMEGVQHLMHTKELLQTKVAKLEALVTHKRRLLEDHSTSAQKIKIDQINELAATGRQIKRLQVAKKRLDTELQVNETDHPSISLEMLTKLRMTLKKRTTDLENDEYDLHTMTLRHENMQRTQARQAKTRTSIREQMNKHKDMYAHAYHLTHRDLLLASSALASTGYDDSHHHARSEYTGDEVWIRTHQGSKDGDDPAGGFVADTRELDVKLQVGEETATRYLSQVVDDLHRQKIVANEQYKQEDSRTAAQLNRSRSQSTDADLDADSDTSPYAHYEFKQDVPDHRPRTRLRGSSSATAGAAGGLESTDEPYRTDLQFMAKEFSRLCDSAVGQLTSKFVVYQPDHTAEHAAAGAGGAVTGAAVTGSATTGGEEEVAGAKSEKHRALKKQQTANSVLSKDLQATEVRGWGVYCYDFLLLHFAPNMPCSCADA